MAKLRCGILPIQIKVGRFRGLSECDCICQICKQAVESELHFMFECQAYEKGHDEFITDSDIDPYYQFYSYTTNKEGFPRAV